jgi:L-alanine-DL-glutamate epimerase-like enolase superfamily enzyme
MRQDEGGLRLEAEHQSWVLAKPFTIARGTKTHADVVEVRLRRGSHCGRGEGVPYPRYNETVPQALAALESCRSAIESGLSFAAIAALPLPMAARNALDCALWDLIAKETGTPAWQRAGLSAPTPLITAYTISLDTAEVMAAEAKTAGRPLLKLKLGRPGDDRRLMAIRAAVPDVRLIIDANEGWSAEVLPAMLRACREAGVELVEQPLPAGADAALSGLSRDCLICADESAHGLDSLAELSGKYDAINIKLDKTGGLTPALALAVAAQAQGLKLMVGCMVATSLAMAPAFLVGQMAQVVDLDGPLLLKDDRPEGFRFNGSLMLPPPRALWG